MAMLAYFGVLGGSWEPVTTDNWAFDSVLFSLTGLVEATPVIGRAVSPDISSYQVP